MSEVAGRLVNFFVRDQGQSTWRRVVCTEDSTFTINSELTKRNTNCGQKGAPGIPDFSASGNAVQNPEPTSSEASYAYIKARILNGTKQEFKYQSAADGILAEGEGIYNYGDGYFTNLEASASADDDGVLSFAWSFEGIGTLDTNESPT